MVNRHSLRRRPGLILGVAAVLAGAAFLAAIWIGAVPIGPATVLDILAGAAGLPGFGGQATPTETAILLNVRLPRALLGVAGGAVLAMGGAMMQAFFRNPLADPALIGVATGSALGAVAMIVLGAVLFQGLAPTQSVVALPLAAFIGALTACTIVYRLARHDRAVDAATMLLCGIAVNALAGAGIGFLTYLADDAQLRDLTFWSLGSLGAATWWHCQVVLPGALLCVAAAPLLARPLNALLLGDAEAMHLGYPVERLKLVILALVCLTGGAVVASCGVIGFVGLIAPHGARLLLGPDHRRLLPLSALLGIALLLGADLVARTAVSPAELPIGVLTALFGGPLFLWLLHRRNRETALA